MTTNLLMIQTSIRSRSNIYLVGAQSSRSSSLIAIKLQRLVLLFAPQPLSRDAKESVQIKILWSFSIWLESVAILPQLFMLQRTGEAETITTHYLFALGLYRALYIPNWLYRYFAEGYIDQIAWVAGLVQTVLYSDFFWIYYTK